MFTHPDRLGQLASEHHHDMLAQASRRRLRSQPGDQSPAAPNAAARITRRLAGAIGRAGFVASGADTPEAAGRSSSANRPRARRAASAAGTSRP